MPSFYIKSSYYTDENPKKYAMLNKICHTKWKRIFNGNNKFNVGRRVA